MLYKKTETDCICLECGTPVTYGRYDRKFCSDSCRYAYHNERRRRSGDYRLKMIAALDRNYRILDSLIRSKCYSVGKIELADMGFSLTAVSSVCRRSRGMECRCYDIRYFDRSGKITDIGYVDSALL